MFFKKSIALLLAILMVISFCVVVSADDGDDTDDDYYYSCGCDSPTPETFFMDYSEIIGSNSHGHIWGDFEVYQCCNCNGYITIITGNRPEGHYGEIVKTKFPDGHYEETGVCEACGYKFVDAIYN